MIPKKIFQTWYTKNLPAKVKDSVNKMIELNDEYDHFLFDDEDLRSYVQNNTDSRTLEAFDMLTVGAAKADLWRYLILFNEGGVYLDIDSEIILPLNNLIRESDDAIITRERNLGKFVQWCLIFSKNHPILKICIDKCVENILTKKTENILKLTGPDVFSESVYEHCNSIGSDFFLVHDQVINPVLEKLQLKLRIFGFDYEGFCNFKAKHSDALYIDKDDWRTESEKKSVFKK